MLHHIEIYVSNLDTSHAFWTTLLTLIGYEEAGRWEDGFSLDHESGTYLTFVQVAAKHAHRDYHRSGIGLNHLAFSVPDRESVDTLHDFCRANGVTVLYEDRHPFANGGTEYYALFVEDPDRIKVEFVAASMALLSHASASRRLLPKTSRYRHWSAIADAAARIVCWSATR